ncbi:MAG: hypothetical protein J3R72DRAFT_426454 [Linnemannia gamsii]|nr:MAG: hypothetical protein J3R72DRAFT_426454 [Linnemannia gamsii]
MTIRTNNQQHHAITNGNNTTQQQQPAAASPNLIPAASVSAAASRHSSLGLGAGIPDSSHGHGHGHGGQRVPQETNSSSTTPTAQAAGATADETAEQVLLSSFKAAALSVTQLYKDSLKFQRAEHAKGYEAALQDLLAFISTHPVVQEKKDLGMTEDEIRQTTSLSIDDVDFNMAASRMMAGANHNNSNINNINNPANNNINMMGNNSRMMGGGNQPLNLNLNVNMDSFGAFHDQPPFKRGRRREGE